jgi:hypothetical protein
MSSNARAGDRLLGRLQSEEGNGTVRMEDRFDAGVDDVWRSPIPIISPPGSARWKVTCASAARSAHASSRADWEGTGRVKVCEPQRRLLVLTKDADEPDAPEEHVIEVTLTADGDKTILVWEERPLPVNLLAAYGAGIQVHADDERESATPSGRRHS